MANMTSSPLSLAYTLCLLLCFCSLHTEVMAIEAASAVNLTYYLHESRGGPGTNGTLWAAAGTGSGGNVTSVGWGTFFVFDSPLKAGNTTDSQHLGRSTGTAIVTTTGGIPDGGVLINCQHIFANDSTYNRSSITVFGQVDFTHDPPWECNVLGGTGYFRGYHGYGLAELMTAADAALIVYKWSFYLSK